MVYSSFSPEVLKLSFLLQLKILAIDDDFNTMKEICISFDKDIYEYKTTGTRTLTKNMYLFLSVCIFLSQKSNQSTIICNEVA